MNYTWREQGEKRRKDGRRDKQQRFSLRYRGWGRYKQPIGTSLLIAVQMLHVDTIMSAVYWLNWSCSCSRLEPVADSFIKFLSLKSRIT